jgi:hypothetical protein
MFLIEKAKFEQRESDIRLLLPVYILAVLLGDIREGLGSCLWA